MIPYGKQQIDKDDIESVVDVMKSDFLTQGPITPIFENKLKLFCKAKYATATVNATSALHLACMSLGVSKGDIVWTSPISFVASANCAVYCGAQIDFVDINSLTYNICEIKLKQKLVDAKKKNKLPKVIIPVHLSGQSCEMKKINELSKEFKFKIIEDASHAIGAEYNGMPVGSCQYSDITVFSFHPVKIITTCEGGACLTNDKNIHNKIYNLRSHGIVRNQRDMINESHGEWYYEQRYLGFNYRLNDLQAALGINQIKKLKYFVKKRHEIADTYAKYFKNNENIITPYQQECSISSYHLYIIKTSNKNGYNRDEIFKRLRKYGYQVNIHYIPIYRHPYYSKNYKTSDFPNCEDYYSKAISLPIYPSLHKSEIKRVVDIIENKVNYQTLF